MPNLYVRTLLSAVEFQGEAQVAENLGVAVEDLRRWLDRREKIPDDVFLRAARLVANEILRRRR